MNMSLDAPGLKRRPRKDGSEAFYWSALAVSRKAADYRTRIVRLHYATPEERAAQCRKLTAELRSWLSGKERTTAFDGTLHSLIIIYQETETSKFNTVQENTRRDYVQRLRMLDRMVGGAVINVLNAVDFTRWHRAFKAPRVTVDANGAETIGKPRVRQAHGLMTMVRILISFGVSMRYTVCAGALAVLDQMEFETPKRRTQAITFEHAEAIVDDALASGRRSIALGQALQFELAMRQVDVTGKWTKANPSDKGGIVHDGKRWAGGISWDHVSNDLKVSKETTKTAATGEWDLRDCPLVMKALAAFPPEDRIGPMIICETTDFPYMESAYARDWRPFADRAGVPKDVWNRDSRAGAITEAFELGASETDTQHFATHADPATTRGYRRHVAGSSKRVAEIRTQGREQRRNLAGGQSART